VGGACGTHGRVDKSVQGFGRPRHRWEDGMRMDLRETGLGGVWIGFDWLRTGTGGGLL
jgi:hypothetical protein